MGNSFEGIETIEFFDLKTQIKEVWETLPFSDLGNSRFEKERDFGCAITLDPDYLSLSHPRNYGALHIREHGNEWKIFAFITENYYEWVNEFYAKHPQYGIVCGNFESEVRATSKKAYKDFLKNFPPNIWDYNNI